MAHLHPPLISQSTISQAEIKIFQKLRQEVSNEWHVVHSLGLTKHNRKPWAEIDFVAIGPPGVFCLEVKGGRIARRDGVWLFTDRDGKTAQKDEGPFEQVGSAAAALYGYLRTASTAIKHTVVGYGVVTPDVLFDVEGPDIELAIVYDQRHVGESFEKYLQRAASYWHQKFSGRRFQALSETERLSVLNVIRSDFDLRPSLRSRVGVVNEELIRLTSEQFRVIESLADNSRVVVKGGAGTGKSLLAVEEAKRVAEFGQSVLLCCFNRQLADYLGRAIEAVEGVTVRSFHRLMSEIVAEAGLNWRLPQAQESDLFEVFYPEICVEILLQSSDRQYDVLLVDEAQDLLKPAYIDVLDLLVRGGWKSGKWRLFWDPQQNIYRGTHAAGVERLLSLQPAQFRLSVNCRNTAPIAVSTAILSGINSQEASPVEGPEVAYHWYADESEETRLIVRSVQQLLSEGIRPEDIVILSRVRLEHSCLRSPARALPFQLSDVSNARYDAGSIRFSTTASFKGLESDVVLVIGINNLSEQEELSDLYVGTSRARALLIVFADRKVTADYQQRAFDYGQHLRRKATVMPTF